LAQHDHARVSAAVAAAEAHTDGEVVTVIAARSDRYWDAGAHWAALAALAWLAVLAAVPTIATELHALFDPWTVPGRGAVLTVATLGAGAVFALAALLLRAEPLRLALTPAATKGRRVHARALELLAAAVSGRTRGRTGVLIYLSLAEHRAEIAAEAFIHERVDAERWGEAMAALLAGARDGRVADGMVDAVALVGAVLAEHFPRSADDANELSDRLIEL
jgi:putative membrane protein